MKHRYVIACVHVSNVSPEVLLALHVRKCFYLSVLPPFTCWFVHYVPAFFCVHLEDRQHSQPSSQSTGLWNFPILTLQSREVFFSFCSSFDGKKVEQHYVIWCVYLQIEFWILNK